MKRPKRLTIMLELYDEGRLKDERGQTRDLDVWVLSYIYGQCRYHSFCDHGATTIAYRLNLDPIHDLFDITESLDRLTNQQLIIGVPINGKLNYLCLWQPKQPDPLPDNFQSAHSGDMAARTVASEFIKNLVKEIVDEGNSMEEAVQMTAFILKNIADGNIPNLD